MAISKKGKRKIVVDNQNYLWWGLWEYDQTTFDGNQIKIVPENQKFLLHYGLEQEEGESKILLILRDERRVWLRSPLFESQRAVITPKGISQIIKWVKNEVVNPAIKVDYWYPQNIKEDIGIFMSEFNEAMS